MPGAGATHWSGARLRHVAPMQHAPVSCGQTAAEQAVVPGWWMPTQAMAATSEHPPLVQQHAPGGAQGSGTQGALSPRYAPTHSAGDLKKHAPEMQHAPMGGEAGSRLTRSVNVPVRGGPAAPPERQPATRTK